MMLPKTNFNWTNLWADLLKGTGTGLLEYDGSRAAQAALAGLKVFDAARERRRQQDQQDQQEQGKGAHQDILLKLLSTMRPEELAALLRLPPEDREAYEAELVETETNHGPRVGGNHPSNAGGASLTTPPPITAPPPQGGRPISVSPFDGWYLQSILPFGSDGALNRPTYRR